MGWFLPFLFDSAGAQHLQNIQPSSCDYQEKDLMSTLAVVPEVPVPKASGKC